MTLTKTVHEDMDQVALIYTCTSCNMSQVGEKGENICCHCGGSMKVEMKDS